MTPLRTKQFLISGFDLSPDNSIYSHITCGALNSFRTVFFFVVTNAVIWGNERKHSHQGERKGIKKNRILRRQMMATPATTSPSHGHIQERGLTTSWEIPFLLDSLFNYFFKEKNVLKLIQSSVSLLLLPTGSKFAL